MAQVFFFELNDKSLPFNKCLATCNYIINEDHILRGKEIELEYQNKYKRLIITNNRRVFINKELNYTLIEILPEDEIKNYFQIDMNQIRDYKGEEAYVLQYPKGLELGFSCGNILSIENDNIIHNCSTRPGSGGGPLILRYKQSVIGIHKGREHNTNNRFAIPIQLIINDI